MTDVMLPTVSLGTDQSRATMTETPSAQQIEKNGLVVTLYMIEMKKENERQNEEIKKQNKEIEYLKTRK
jgi:hypothetical protein